MTTADSIRILEAFRKGAEKQTPNLGRIIARMKAIERQAGKKQGTQQKGSKA
jgi:hypothetical protein